MSVLVVRLYGGGGVDHHLNAHAIVWLRDHTDPDHQGRVTVARLVDGSEVGIIGGVETTVMAWQDALEER